MLPAILLQFAYLFIFIWSVAMLVQDFQGTQKNWLTVLLHISVAIVSLNYLLVSLGVSI
ncbi:MULTISPECIES: hypothetical protein [unclassified Psychrobacillus]|uniref:hypothetical protein n=1 Tax=unclassified Psychrobacillus TaxID=2636677 RepID=UPI00146D5A43|nr:MULTISPECIES: hypothetical protein [unclassified Psychrobacillus]MCM3356702.1 hypothetical protein [Psychrobacillus sp. MER TA 171]NME05018.1 hypothetical protein [Psychrobacillus sp. BL-248-WT-3]